MNNNLISVGIATFNRLEMLKKALNSVMNQTYKDIEILIADNHSTDGTEEYCLECAKKDKRIKYFRHEKNIGMYENGIFLLNQIKTEYYLSLCDDDWVSDNFIEETIKHLQNSKVACMSSDIILYDKDYKIMQKCKTKSICQKSYFERMKRYPKAIWDLKACCCIMNTDCVREILKDTKTRFCEDQIIGLKYLYMGKMPVINNAIYHKLHNGCTKDLDTLKSTFNLNDFTPENYPYKLAQCLKDAIINDEFFKTRLNEDERKNVAKEVYKNTIKVHFQSTSITDILRYMWKHPIFIFKKRFYKLFIDYIHPKKIDYKFSEYFDK